MAPETAPDAGRFAPVSRVPALSSAEAGPLAKAAFAYSRREFGRVAEPLAVTARHTKIMAGHGAFELAVARSKRCPEHLKLLGEMKAAVMAGCEWCIDIGAFLMDRGGIPAEQVRDLPRHRDSDAFDELERLVLDYAEGMSSTPVDVSDELVSRLREHLDDEQLVELTAVIALENYRARFNWALGIEMQGFAEGGACPMPQLAGEAGGANEVRA
jgi:alkylhydroperoxidase family enzyme